MATAFDNVKKDAGTGGDCMLPIGICVGFEDLPMAHAIGYDFVEVPLSDLAALPEGDFEELVDYVRAADIEVRGCYNMLPESIKITGEGVSARIQHDYLQKAFSRAGKLGARFIALDGAKNRHVPQGGAFPTAWRQMGNFARLVQGHASEAGLMVGLEPIRKADCNLLNLLSEATIMASLMQLDHVGVLANLGSMAMASEPLSALKGAMPLIAHVHLENVLCKGLPCRGDGENYEKIFKTLESIGYTGGVGIRSQSNGDFNVQARQALEYLREVQTH